MRSDNEFMIRRSICSKAGPRELPSTVGVYFSQASSISTSICYSYCATESSSSVHWGRSSLSIVVSAAAIVHAKLLMQEYSRSLKTNGMIYANWTQMARPLPTCIEFRFLYRSVTMRLYSGSLVPVLNWMSASLNTLAEGSLSMQNSRRESWTPLALIRLR